MDKFTQLEGVAAPLKMINVDTDMIIPARFLKTIKRTGLGQHRCHAPAQRVPLSARHLETLQQRDRGVADAALALQGAGLLKE